MQQSIELRRSVPKCLFMMSVWLMAAAFGSVIFGPIAFLALIGLLRPAISFFGKPIHIRIEGSSIWISVPGGPTVDSTIGAYYADPGLIVVFLDGEITKPIRNGYFDGSRSEMIVRQVYTSGADDLLSLLERDSSGLNRIGIP